MRKQKGFTLLEVLVSMVIMSIFSIAIFSMIGWLTVRSRQFQYATQAGELLQEGMEVTYNVMISDWDGTIHPYVGGNDFHPVVFFNGAGSKPQQWRLMPGEESNLDTRFKRKIEIFPVCRDSNSGLQVECESGGVVDLRSRRVIVRVEWQENGNQKTAQANLLLTQL